MAPTGAICASRKSSGACGRAYRTGGLANHDELKAFAKKLGQYGGDRGMADARSGFRAVHSRRWRGQRRGSTVTKLIHLRRNAFSAAFKALLHVVLPNAHDCPTLAAQACHVS